MIDQSHLWAYIGTIYLLILTYQDYKDKMLVDDRHNSFMMGVTVGLIYLTNQRPIWFIIFTLLLFIGLSIVMKLTRVFGEADINTFTWIFWGLAMINVYYLAFFGIILILITCLYLFFKHGVFKIRGESQYYIVILLSFVATNIYLKFY